MDALFLFLAGMTGAKAPFSYLVHIEKAWAGSEKDNGREPKSCLGQVFKFKFACFVTYAIIAQHIQACPSLELKTQPRLSPVSLSLSMVWVRKNNGMTNV